MSSADTTTTTEEDAPPRDELREAILAEFTDKLGDALVASELIAGRDLFIRVDRAAWARAGEVAKNLGFRFFDYVSAVDWLPSPFGRYEDAEVDKALAAAAAPAPAEIKHGYTGGEARFQVIARVYDINRKVGVHLRADVGDDLRIDTWVGNYAGANWHEREIHEMYGITFVGHPYLANIYLPTGFEGYPLRKDYPLLARVVKPWPGIVDVEPMIGEDPSDSETEEAGESE